MRRTGQRGNRGRVRRALWLVALLVAGCASAPEVRDHREAADSHAGVGLHLLREGQFGPATERLERALELQPEHPRALAGLGLVLEMEGAPEAALDHHRRAVAAAPESGALRNNLGRVLCRHGDVTEALEHLEAAASAPAYARPEVPLTNAAICALDHGDIEAAHRYTDAALKAAPDFPAAWRSRGEILQLQGEASEAVEALERYAEVAGMLSPRGLYWAVHANRAAGMEGRADAYRRQLHEHYPDSRYAERLKGERGTR